MNKKQNIKQNIDSLINDEGERTSNQIEIAETFNKYFQSVYSEEKNLIDADLTAKTQVNMNSKPLDLIKIEDIRLRLSKLNPNKSKEYDEVHPLVLNKCSESLAEPLYILFVNSLAESEPKDWLLANVTPIHKKRNKSIPNNYRPVSLTSVICKVM